MVGGSKAIPAVLGAIGTLALAVGLLLPGVGILAWSGAMMLVVALALSIASASMRQSPATASPVSASGRVSDALTEPDTIAASEDRVSTPAVHQEQGRGGQDSPDEIDSPAPTGIEPSDALEAFIGAAAPVGDLVAAHVWLLDPATRTMRLVTAFGEMRPNAEPLPIDSSSLGKAAEQGHALLHAEQRRILGGTEQTVWRYAVPLKAGDAQGCAALDFVSDSPDAASLNRAAAMTRGQLSAALALHVSRTETGSARALLAATREILRLVDPQRIVETALDHAVALSGAETGSVMLVEPDSNEMTIRASIGLPERVVAQTRVSEGEGIAGWVLTTRRSLVVEDLEDKGPRSRRHGVRSAMAVPICDDDSILGVLNVGSRVFHARFSAYQLEILESIGRIVGLALRNASAHESSRDLYFETVRALAVALETKDPYSRGTTDRVYDVAMALGEAMGLTTAETQALRVAALLHDIGMSAAGDLSSAGERPLSTVEWAMLKMHPVIAADVLEQAPALRAAVPIVYHHHEHYDGQGYVLGLAGEAIPLGARVLSVADAFVAMTSSRAYRRAMSSEEALCELQDKAGSQFDPEVVRALVELLGTSEHSRGL